LNLHGSFLTHSENEIGHWTLLGVLAAVATAIQIIESPLPRFLPWLKPGLSNAVVLFGIMRVSPTFGFKIVLLRTFLTGFALGILFSPANLLSLVGGIASALTMALAFKWGSSLFSVYGISVLGALANNFAQLASVGTMFGGGIPLWLNVSIMMWIAIPSGLIVAGITNELLRRTS